MRVFVLDNDIFETQPWLLLKCPTKYVLKGRQCFCLRVQPKGVVHVFSIPRLPAREMCRAPTSISHPSSSRRERASRTAARAESYCPHRAQRA